MSKKRLVGPPDFIVDSEPARPPDQQLADRKFLWEVVQELRPGNKRWPGLWTRLESLLKREEALSRRVEALELECDQLRHALVVRNRDWEAENEERGEAEREADTLKDALQQIADNAGSWHGPQRHSGHERALKVIGGVARDVLASVSARPKEATPDE